MKKVRAKSRPTEIGVIKTFSLSPSDEIGEIAVECTGCTYYYNNLAELCEKWEDYDEPKSLNEIDVVLGAIREYCYEHLCHSGDWEKIKILNTIEEKLMAWKRLKDKGFRFNGYTDDSGDSFSCQVIRCRFDDFGEKSREDLDLLFGGKE